MIHAPIKASIIFILAILPNEDNHQIQHSLTQNNIIIATHTFAAEKVTTKVTSLAISTKQNTQPPSQNSLPEHSEAEEVSLINSKSTWNILGILSIFLAIFSIFIHLLKRLKTLNIKQSDYDLLTGLPNRFLVQDRLNQLIKEAQRNKIKIIILSIDIDNFKEINDHFGHKMGDNLLKNISERLKMNLRETDTIGHLDGDQFLILFSHLRESTDAVIAATNILSLFNKPFTIKNHEIVLNVNIGISTFPEDGNSASNLLQNAEFATHQSKNEKHSKYFFYTKELKNKISRKMLLDEHSRGALERNEFYVVYQPQFDAKNKRIVSFEALLRWSNPVIGNIPPTEFIPIIEHNGLIEPIGLFVLNNALTMLSRWQSLFDKNLTMAINISPCQFRSNTFIKDIETAIKNSGVSNNSIEFEITEGVLMNNTLNADKYLSKIQSMGIKLAMDDFGTGYSSMSYLRKYTFNTLKIDYEFVSDLTTNTQSLHLVLATIGMSHKLGMTVIAEGVETEEQYKILQDNGCDIIQGWLFSKALQPKDIELKLSQQTNTN
ncbi:MAG: bifunctional diguanylate cyclase/phosphodiesterase [Cellvibrionaceae bacterium]